MAKNTDAKPWERQDGETPKQFEAFCVYRDMGEERSLSAVSQKLNKSKALLGRWSAAHKWVERCTDWDNEQDRVARQEQLKAIKKMRERHAKIAEAGLVKAAQALAKMKPEDFKPGDIPRFLEACSKLERLSRGDTSEVIEERQGEAISAVQIYIPDNNRGRDKETFDDLEV